MVPGSHRHQDAGDYAGNAVLAAATRTRRRREGSHSPVQGARAIKPCRCCAASRPHRPRMQPMWRHSATARTGQAAWPGMDGAVPRLSHQRPEPLVESGVLPEPPDQTSPERQAEQQSENDTSRLRFWRPVHRALSGLERWLRFEGLVSHVTYARPRHMRICKAAGDCGRLAADFLPFFPMKSEIAMGL